MSLLAPVLLGAALGVSFNPVTGLLGSVAAAALTGAAGRRTDRRLLAVGVLVVAWVLGDGLRVLGRVREAVDGGAAHAGWLPYVPLVVWVLLGLACYGLPAWVGSFVGRRVTRGTGWLSAAGVAATLSLALSSSASQVSDALGRLSAGL